MKNILSTTWTVVKIVGLLALIALNPINAFLLSDLIEGDEE